MLTPPDLSSVDLFKDVRPLIFSYINDIEDINNIRLTCKYFKSYINNETTTLTTRKNTSKNKQIYLKLKYLLKNFINSSKLKYIYIPIYDSHFVFSNILINRDINILKNLDIGDIIYDNDNFLIEYILNISMNNLYTKKNLILTNKKKNDIECIKFTENSIDIHLKENETIIKNNILDQLINNISPQRIFDKPIWPKLLLYCSLIAENLNIKTYLHSKKIEQNLILKTKDLFNISLLNSFINLTADNKGEIVKLFRTDCVETKLEFTKKHSANKYIASESATIISYILNDKNFVFKYHSLEVFNFFILSTDIPIMLKHFPKLRKITVLVNDDNEIIHNLHMVNKVKKYVLSTDTYVKVNY
jgi:putative flippase GtrA